MRRRFLFPFIAALAVAGVASASRTLLYFNVTGGVRSLALTAPTEIAGDPSCPVDPKSPVGCTSGCAYVKPEGDLNCGNDILDPDTLTSDQWTTFTYVTQEAWGRDADVDLSSPTDFSYWASYCGTAGWAQPAMRISYYANDGLGGVVKDVQGVPCPNCQLTNGCQIDQFSDILHIVKTTGGNVSTVSHSVSGPLPIALPAGSTIIVDVWNANGQATGILYSHAGASPRISFIDVPYSKNNFSIRGAISPQYVKASSTATHTFTLDNSAAGSPTLNRLVITIPGGIGGSALYYAAVSDPPTILSRTAQGTVVTQATSLAPGTISIDFGSWPVASGSTVYVTFNATAPTSPIQSIDWSAVAYAGADQYPLADLGTDSLDTAVLPLPPVPTGLTVMPANVDAGGQALTLMWNGPAAVETYAITTYTVFRPTYTAIAAVPPQGGFQQADTTWKPTTSIVSQVNGISFTETGLINGQCYCYTVGAANPVGASAVAAPAVCGTPYAAPPPPNSVTVLVSSGQAKIDWDASAGTYPTATYQIWRSSSACPSCRPVLWQSIPAPTRTFTDTSLSNSVVYSYVVIPVDTQGHRSAFTGTVTGQPAVNPPAGLTPHFDTAGGGVSLSWQTSRGNAFPLQGYNVYRATSATAPLVRLGGSPTLASPAATVYLDTGVAAAGLYFYAVSAISSEGGTTEGAMSPAVKILVPPSAPATLTLLPAPGAALYLEWSISPNGPGTVDAYWVYRATFAGVPLANPIGFTVGITSTATVDTTLAYGTRYHYRVTAFLNRGGSYAESLPGPEQEAVVEPGTPTGLTDQAGDMVVHLSWDDLGVSQEVTSYSVYRASWSPSLGFVFVGSTTYTSLDDPGVENGFIYYYRVTAVNAGGEGSPAETVVGTIPFRPPGPPGPVQGFAWSAWTSLVWGPAEETTYPVAFYEIWRGDTPGTEVFKYKIDDSSASVYTDTQNVTAGFTYFYQVHAVDTAGNRSAGSTEVAITPAQAPCPPTTLSGLAAAAQVELHWLPVDGALCKNPATFAVSGYRVYRSTFSGGGYQPLVPLSIGAFATAYIDTTVTTGIVYYYAVRTYDSGVPPNESVSPNLPYGPVFSPEFLGAPRVPASEPGSLTVLAGVPAEHDGAVKLSWIPSVPGTFAVVGYDVIRSTTVGGPETHGFVSGGDALTYLDVGLTNKAFYYYRVVPVEENGFAGNWASATATPFQDPSPPGSLTIIEGDGVLVLGWAAPAQTSYPVTAYRVSRASFPGIAGSAVLAPDPSWGTTFADSGVANGTGYYYHVQTYDSLWRLSFAYSGEISGTPFAPPAPPASLTASSVPGGASLSWTPAVPTTYPVSAYRIMRGLTASATTTIATVWGAAASVYADSALANGSTYFYAIRTRDSLGHMGAASSTVSTSPADRPCPPAGLTALPSATQVVLSWLPVNGALCVPPSTFAVSGYVVYRATYAGAAVAPFVVRVGLYATAYTDTAVVPGETYYYRVRTFDNRVPVNEGTVFSAEADATPRVPAGAPAGLTIPADSLEHDGMLKLTWNASAAGSLPVIGYNVRRSTCPACPQTFVFGPGSAETLAYLDSPVANKTYYYYRVAPVEAKFFEGNWAAVAGTAYADPLAPAAPAIREGDGQLLISWTAPAQTSWPVTAYRVSRATWPGTTGLQVLTPDPVWATTYTDTGVVNAATYFYHVQTYDSFGHLSHAFSAEVSGTPFAPPSAPLALTVSPGNNNLMVSWDDGPAGTYPISGYAIYRAAGAPPACGGAPLATVCCGVLQYQDTTVVEDGTFYFYKVAAFDSVSSLHLSPCTAAISASPYATIEPPGKPSNLTANWGPALVALAWQQATATSRPISGYTIFRTTFTPNPAVTAGRVDDTWGGAAGVAYSDASAQNGYAYYYRTRTRDDNSAVPTSPSPYVSEASNEVFSFPAAVPLGLTVSPGSASLSLSWQETKADVGGIGVSGYQVFRSTGPAGPFVLKIQTVPPSLASWTDSPLPPGQPFWYEVRAVHGLVYVSGFSTTVSGAAQGQPSIPSVTASAGDRAVDVSWTPSTSPFPPVSTYVVYRGSVSGFLPGASATTLTGAEGSFPLTYRDTGLANGAWYYYRVKAVDSALSTSTSTDAAARPLGTPLGLGVVPGDGSVALAWSAPADPGGVSGYLVYRRTQLQPEGVTATVFGPATVAYTDAAVLNGTYYYYRVRAFDHLPPAMNLGAFSNTASGQPATPPGAPSFNLVVAGGQEIDLCWGPPASNGTFPLSGYRLFRSSGGGAYSLRVSVLGGVTGMCFSDIGLTNGVSWSYKVSAFDNEVPPVEGPASNPVSAVPYAIPAAPQSLTALSAPGVVALGWSTSFIQSTYPVAGWNVYRGLSAGGESAVPLNGVPVTATFYADTTAVNGTRYFYVVKTVDVPGHLSAAGNEISSAAFVPPDAPAVALSPGDRRITLSWAPVAGTYTPITTYAVYRATYSGASPAALVRLTGAMTPTVYADLGGTTGLPYYYRVGAIDSDRFTGPHETRSAQVFGVLLGVPLSLSAIPGDTRVTLGWSPPPGGTAGTSGYFIFRRTLLAGESVIGVANGPGATSYLDAAPPLSNGIAYYYRVAPVDRIAAPTTLGGYSPAAQAIPGNGPSAPTIVSIVPGSARIDFNWSPPSALGSNPLAGYRLWRSTGGPSFLFSSVAVSVTFYADTGLTNGASFSYRVNAFDTVGIEGPLSNSKTATPYSSPNPPGMLTIQLRNGSLFVSWATVYLSGSTTVYVATTFPQSAFNVYRMTTPNPPVLPAPVGQATATFYTDTGLANGTAYYYKVATVDRWGHLSTTSLQVSGVPYAPAGPPLSLSAVPGNRSVMLTWRPGSPGTWTPLSGYYLYRGLSSGSETLLAGPLFSTIYADASAVNGTTYWYKVGSRDARGNPGSLSAEVSEQPQSGIVNPPLVVRASVGAKGITVSWTMTVEGVAPGGPTAQYVVLRSTCASCGYDTVTPSASVYVSATVFSSTDTTTVSGRYYRYAVRSVVLVPLHLESLIYRWSVVEIGSACGPPPAPGSIAATAGSAAVGLAWTAPGGTSPCQLPLSYLLYRSQDGGATWVTVTATGALAYTDTGVVNGTTYVYRVNSVSAPGTESVTGALSAAVVPMARTTAIYLSRNAFAPMRGESLALNYTLDRASAVSVRIFTISGLKVWDKRIDNQPAGPAMGSYDFTAPGAFPGWDGKADDGKTVASGVYLIEFEAGSFRKQMKVIVIK